MAIALPQTTPYVIKKGDKGIHVWALQRACNKLSIVTDEDMAFGDQTAASVKQMQAVLGVGADGVVGPTTQRALAIGLATQQERFTPSLPKNLLRSLIEGESGNYIAAVNWGTAGGVDCGYCQRRLYVPQYTDDATVKRCFDSTYQIRLLADRVVELCGIFLPRFGVGENKQLAWRLAVLNHNYPYGADKISQVGIGGLGSYWTTAQSWVEAIHANFRDGTPVLTPLAWCQYYSLGSTEHNWPGLMTKYVQIWA